jgi:holin-like protein
MKIRQALLVVAQIGILAAMSELGYALAAWGDIPLPGNMLGMVLLFALLASGVVRLQWFEAGSTLLLKHLAFFFVPIAVGLMALGDVLRESGVALLVILLASAAVGIVLAGGATQWLASRRYPRNRQAAAEKPIAP